MHNINLYLIFEFLNAEIKKKKKTQEIGPFSSTKIDRDNLEKIRIKNVKKKRKTA